MVFVESCDLGLEISYGGGEKEHIFLLRSVDMLPRPNRAAHLWETISSNLNS